MAGLGSKQTGTHAAKRSKQRAAKRTKTSSPKAEVVVRLVHALTSSFGGSDGAEVGRGIVDLLTDAYTHQGRTLPRWVKDLIAHYAPKKRSS